MTIINHYDVLKAVPGLWSVSGAFGRFGEHAAGYVRTRYVDDQGKTLRGTWADVTKGHPMVWVTMPSVGGAWYPAGATTQITALTSRRTGKPLKVGPPTTVEPCPANTSEWYTCGKPPKAGSVYCGLHTAVAARHRAAQAAADERTAARQAKSDRKAEAHRAAVETLDRVAPMLEELGLVPAVVKIDGGQFVVPPEFVESLVQQVTQVLGVLE